MASCQQQQCPKPQPRLHVEGQTVTLSCKAHLDLALGINECGNPRLLPSDPNDSTQKWEKVKVEEDATGINICGFVSKDPVYFWKALYANGDEVALTPDKVDKIHKSMLNVLWTEKGPEDGFEHILKAIDMPVIEESLHWTAEDGVIKLRIRNNLENQLWNPQIITPPN